MSNSKAGYGLVLKQKQFCKLMFSNVVNRFGDSIDSIAFVWLVYAITNNAAWSAIIFGVNKIPTIFLQPFAGAMIENKNKKAIMITTDICRGICVAFIAFGYFIGILQPWILVVITLIISSVEAFALPAASSVIPNVLDKESMDFGISLSTSVSTVAELVGIAFAGIIISQFGIAAAIGLDAVTFMISAFLKSTVDTKERKYENAKVNFSGYLELLKDGAAYTLKNKVIFNIIILAVSLNALFVPFNSLQAPLVQEILQSKELMLSVLSIAITIGMILASVIFPFVSQKMSGKVIVAISGSFFGLYYILLVVFGAYLQEVKLLLYIAVAIVTLIAGLLITFANLYIQVTFMKTVENEYIARSFAIMTALCSSSMPIASFIIGAIVAFVATKFIFIGCGILLIILMLILPFRMQLELKTKEEDMMEGKVEVHPETNNPMEELNQEVILAEILDHMGLEMDSNISAHGEGMSLDKDALEL